MSAGMIKRSDLIEAHDYTLNDRLFASKELAFALKRLKDMGVLTYQLEPGQYAGDAAKYRVTLTDRAKSALSNLSK